MNEKDREPASRQLRKPYSAPSLRCFGDIREITQSPVMDMTTGVDMVTGNFKS